MGKGPVLRLKPMKPGARKPGSRFVTNTTDSAHSSRTQELFMHNKCKIVVISMKQCFFGQKLKTLCVSCQGQTLNLKIQTCRWLKVGFIYVKKKKKKGLIGGGDKFLRGRFTQGQVFLHPCPDTP